VVHFLWDAFRGAPGPVAEGVAVKQTVSAPVALIVIALCAALALVIFGRREPEAIPSEEMFVLPYAPPVEDADLKALRTNLRPLGVSVVFPPLGDDRMRGARIALVMPGGPGAAGGLKPGDLVTSFNGRAINHPFALPAAVASADPDRPSEVIIERVGEEQKLVITGMKPMVPKGKLF